MPKITYTQAGQPRPYADSVYRGHVTADSRQEAVETLSTAFRHDLEGEEQEWHHPRLESLSEASNGLWAFHIILPFTD